MSYIDTQRYNALQHQKSGVVAPWEQQYLPSGLQGLRGMMQPQQSMGFPQRTQPQSMFSNPQSMTQPSAGMGGQRGTQFSQMYNNPLAQQQQMQGASDQANYLLGLQHQNQDRAQQQQLITDERNRQKTGDFWADQARQFDFNASMANQNQTSHNNALEYMFKDQAFPMLMQQLKSITQPETGTGDPNLDAIHQAAIAQFNAQKNQMGSDLQNGIYGIGQEGTTLAGDKARQLGLNEASGRAGIEGDFARLMMENQMQQKQMQMQQFQQLFGMMSGLFGGGGGASGYVGGGAGMPQGGGNGLMGLLQGMQGMPTNASQYMQPPAPQMPMQPQQFNMEAPRQEAPDMFAGQGGGQAGAGLEGLLQQLMSGKMGNLPPEIMQMLMKLLGGGR